MEFQNSSVMFATFHHCETDLVYSWQVVLSVRSSSSPTLTITTCSPEFLAADSRAQPTLEERTSLGLDSMIKMLSSPTGWSLMLGSLTLEEH